MRPLARRRPTRPLHRGSGLLRSLVLCLAAQAGTAWSADAAAVRAQEIASCLPGELVTWGDGADRPAAGGQVRLVYRHAGAPARFSRVQVLAAVQAAAIGWAGCGVPTAVLDEAAASSQPAGLVVVQWNESETRGNFALANLHERTLSLSAALFDVLALRNPRHPALDTLQMALSHEMGHFFGLMAHSRRCADVMSYYQDSRGQPCSTRDGGSWRRLPEYRALLPTACDLARCRAVNSPR